MTIKGSVDHYAPAAKKFEALPQVVAVFAKNTLLLGFGMTLGFPTILIPSFSGDDPSKDFVLSQEEISWIGSVNLICVPIGCLVSGQITQTFGRKKTMQMVNLPFIVAWLLFNFSTQVWHVFLALSIVGLSGGLLEAPVLTYVAEITQPHLRGMLASTSTMAVILGITIQFFLGTFLPWRTVALVNLVIPVCAIVFLFFVPESPVWLVMNRKFEQARESIAWLRGWTTVDKIEPEFQELCRHLKKSEAENPDSSEKLSTAEALRKVALKKLETLKLFKKKNFVLPYSLVSFAFVISHFGGMNTLQTYAVQIFATFDTPIDKYYATIILGIAEFVGCVACIFLIHILGKRTLNFISMISCGVCFLVVATYAFCNGVFYLAKVEFEEINSNSTVTRASDENNEVQYWNWAPTSILILSAFLSHLGIRILPWILTGEVYSNETRAAASGFSSGIGYVFGFLSNKVFLAMISGITLPGTFWFYSAVSFLGTVALYFWLPETEGKTLHEIADHFAGIKKLDKKVRKKSKQTNIKDEVNLAYVDTENNYYKKGSYDFESKL